MSSAVETPVISLPSPLIFKDSPNFLTALVPVLDVKVIGLFLTAFNCCTLTASVAAVPSATPVIFLLFKPKPLAVKFKLVP